MPFFPKEYEKLVAQGLNRLRADTNITQTTPGSKARFILDTISREQANQHALFDQNLLQCFVQFAEDRFLDFFGDIMKVPRWEATHATVDTQRDNFIFYVEQGTFGDINHGMGFTIPAGTQVFTVDFDIQRSNIGMVVRDENFERVVYATADQITCHPDASSVSARIRAEVEGSHSDVARNALRKHNFAGYALGDRNLLMCRNKFAISNGRDRETDESYRYRLENSFKAKERAIKIAVRLAALNVPGVADVLMVNAEQGPGSYSLYVQGVAPTVSDGLINNVLSEVEGISAFGIRPFVLAPVIVGLEFVIALRWRDGAVSSDKILIQSSIRDTIEMYLNNHTVGISVDINALAAGVLSISPDVVGLGYLKPGGFEEIYVHRSAPDGEGTQRTLFTGDIIPVQYNERAMLETSGRFRGIQFL